MHKQMETPSSISTEDGFVKEKIKTERNGLANVIDKFRLAEKKSDVWGLEELEDLQFRIEDITKFKEAFDFFDWNHTSTIATSVSCSWYEFVTKYKN